MVDWMDGDAFRISDKRKWKNRFGTFSYYVAPTDRRAMTNPKVSCIFMKGANIAECEISFDGSRTGTTCSAKSTFRTSAIKRGWMSFPHRRRGFLSFRLLSLTACASRETDELALHRPYRGYALKRCWRKWPDFKRCCIPRRDSKHNETHTYEEARLVAWLP